MTKKFCNWKLRVGSISTVKDARGREGQGKHR